MPSAKTSKVPPPLVNPLCEKKTATFVWRGKKPVQILDDLHRWDDAPQVMTLAAPNLWQYSMQLPRDAYLEYAFLDPSTGHRLADPLNPNLVFNGVNGYNNFFYMPAGAPTELILPVPPASRGRITRHQVDTCEHAATPHRMVHLYHPPVDGPVPLLVVFDGPDYLQRAHIARIVDNLTLQKRIRPLAMALVQNGGVARLLEYSCADATLDLIRDQILPLAQQHLNLLPPRRDPYGILGASMGGLMALYTGLRLPKIFGRVLSQSGAFFLEELHSIIGDLVRCLPPPPIKIWMDVGRLEYLLPGNRKMHRLLLDRGFHLTYCEFPGGHNYTSWQNDLWRGLEALFG